MAGASPNAGTSALSKSPTKRHPGQTMGGAGTTMHHAPSGDEKGLSSPTSVSMQNSFIIKNADESFDLYY
jgi:hypothetical protein